TITDINNATPTDETLSTMMMAPSKLHRSHTSNTNQAWNTMSVDKAVPATLTLSGALPMPMSTPSPSSGDPSGTTLTSIAAVVGVVTAIVLSIIAVWQCAQGIRYPRRKHEMRMERLDAELRATEEILARRRASSQQVRGISRSELSSNSGEVPS
ncbi:hypothetical protein FRB96_004331, partial [Tulasnella sp. 330]